MKCRNFLLLFFGFIVLCKGDDGDSDPYRHTQVLDKEGKYVLEWRADIEESRIYFNVTVQTRGYVGFGLSKKGRMLGADIVIGGVHRNGSSYFADRHGVADQKTEVDASQDWTLDSAWERQAHTFLSFSRPFETCDKANDLPINNDVLAVIWAYGERDNVNEYHYQNRGSFNVYLLDPSLTPQVLREQEYLNVTRPQPVRRLGDWKVWNIDVDIELPTSETRYVCTYHKPPTRTKHHIVGFRTVMGEVEKRHVHHFLFHVCYPPKGISADELFGRHLGQPGEQCYLLNRADNPLPVPYCQEVKYVYAVGAEPLFFPEHIGMPLSESSDEYYMLQMHYDNPQEIPGIRLQFSLEAFYTKKLRKFDGGTLFSGVAIPGSPSIIVPPSDTNHIVYGHCAADCTRRILPEGGINVFGILLHTHLSGKGMRTIHIQNLQETAIQADDNYRFDHQPVRILREERNILPGDMIVSRCIYDTTNRTRATVGGFSTRDEMCDSVLFYYPRIRHTKMCSGEIRSDAYRNFLQIFESDWSDERREEVVISPPNNAGLTISEVASRIDWDISRRTELQTHHRFLPQVSYCAGVGPEEVTRDLLRQTGQGQNQLVGQNLSPLRKYLTSLENRASVSETFTELNKEIRIPGSEYVSLWPKDLKFYSPPTICPA